MQKRSLHLDLLHSGKYRQQIVKAKKGKGAYNRHDKHKKARSNDERAFLLHKTLKNSDFLPQLSAWRGKKPL